MNMKYDITIHGLFFANILFFLGFLGTIIRKNVFFILLGIEIMINSSYLLFIITDSVTSQLNGHMVYIFSICISTASVIINLSLILNMYKSFRNLDINFKN